jgi:hypothetical protein
VSGRVKLLGLFVAVDAAAFVSPTGRNVDAINW